MKFLDRALGAIGLERRATVDMSASGTFWSDLGIHHHPMNPRRAESVSSVYACVSAISETIATLPLILYRRSGAGGEGRDRALDHPLYNVLHDAPNDQQTGLEFREQMQAAVLLRGNAYAEIRRGYDGQVRALLPIRPEWVNVLLLESGRLLFEVYDNRGNMRRLLQEEVLHLRHRSENGIIGISPISAAREVVELALAERDHGNTVFANGARLNGVLKSAGQLNKDQVERLKTSWQQQYSGGANAGKTAILEAGMEYQPISMTLEDSEWIASRQFSVEEVCRLFRVPPTIVGDLRHGNYSNSVEMSRQFVVLSLRRHLTMWEQGIARCCLSEAARRTYFAEHSVEGLLRGDPVARADFYTKGIDSGWLFADEVRQLENLPVRETNAPVVASPQASVAQAA